MSNENDRYITDEQAAANLGVSARTIQRWGEDGKVRRRKTGRRWMFNQADLDRMALDLRIQRDEPSTDQEIAALRQRLEQATYRIGYLEAQLGERILPDAQRQMETELAKIWTERDILSSQLQQANERLSRAEAPWRLWVLVGLIIVIAVLSTLLVVFVMNRQ